MRVLFYYTHKQTLGHTTRSVSLATALCRQKAEVLILQGGVPQPFIRFPQGCKVLDIPLPFDTRGSFQSHAVAQSSNARAEFILKAAADFSPEVLITEFFPFGRLAYLPELLPLLRYLRKKGTRIIASIGYPLLTDLERLGDPQFSALHRSLFALYDQFLVHTPQELETPYIQETYPSALLSRSYAAIIKSLKEKIIYTGYIFPEKIITAAARPPNTNTATIVISRGGGAVYPKLISVAIEAQRQLDKEIQTIIACGPATSAQEMAAFKASLSPQEKERIFLTDLTDLDGFLQNCKVSVSLCGYNTSVQLMRYGTPSVIVPYKNSLSKTPNDQIARSRLLRERFASLILDYDSLSAPSLADAISQQMASSPPKPAPADWFNGAEVAARVIVQDTAN